VRTVAIEDNRLDLLAVAEAILEREGKVTYDPAQVETSEYFHFQDAFEVFPPGAEDELLALVGEQLGKAIVKRWKSDSSLLPGTPQFVYAAGQPQPMAAVLIAPPNPEKGIRGSSNAAYPSGQNRVLFGRFGAVQDGVRFINTMYYVADGVVAA
jgi:hypothetical protein